MIYALKDILTDDQINLIIKKWTADHRVCSRKAWSVVKADIKSAGEGISGFLGDHLKVKLTVKIENSNQTISLFIKMLPKNNKPKANFIDEGNFFRRETLMYSIIDEIDQQNGITQWHPKAYLCNETILVMPDLLIEGYRQKPQLEYFDYDHILLTVASVARFHAATANYETKKSLNVKRPFRFNNEYKKIMAENNFKECLWLKAGAKLMANFLSEFSSNYKYAKSLEPEIYDLFIEACNSMNDNNDSLNVLIHKDLWTNNIMFRYSDNKPTTSLLIDFQCMRYGPPAFDVMSLLYLTTSASLREKYENSILRHYFTTFKDSLDHYTEERVRQLHYDFDEFIKWCEKARMFGILIAVTIFPYCMMSPTAAKKVFDDPDTFDYYTSVDRTEPVIAHSYQDTKYKDWILQVSEEFFKRYVLLKQT